MSTLRAYRGTSRFLLGNSRSTVDRPIEGREIEGEPADEPNSGSHCCSPPVRAVLGQSPLSIQRRTPEVWWPSPGLRLCIFRVGCPPGPPTKRSFPGGGGKENCFSIRLGCSTRLLSSFTSPTMALPGPFSTTPYSPLTVCFPFGITVCGFLVPRCRSHRSRGTCAAGALSGVAIRRTSNGRRVPPSAADPSVAGSRLSHLEVSFCTHHRERRTSKAALHRQRRQPPVVALCPVCRERRTTKATLHRERGGGRLWGE